jgi:hypothetical protein
MRLQDRAMSEEKIQGECYMWFHNTFPHLRGLLCYNLNNSRNKIDGNRNKALGLQKGRSDMVLYFDQVSYMMEFKTDEGKQTPDQKEWERIITEQGFTYTIIRDLDQFKEHIISIVGSTFANDRKKG